MTASRARVKIGRVQAPDTRLGPVPRVGELLLARPGRGPAGFPAVVLHPAERWAAPGEPLPYRARPGRRRTAVALYLGGGEWCPALLAQDELARLTPSLARWPGWREALLSAGAALVEALELAPAPAPWRAAAAALDAASRPPRPPAPLPWLLRARPVERVGG